jgi:hypothetical protein
MNMANEIASFWWQIPNTGFRWIEARVLLDSDGKPAYALTANCRIDDQPQWVMTDDLVIGQRYTYTRYNPLIVETGLFRIFAELPIEDRNAMLAFANKYGRLGPRVWLETTRPDNPQQLVGAGGETLDVWVKEIEDMKRAVQIWGLLLNRNVAELSRYVRWEDEQLGPDGTSIARSDGWYYDSHPDMREKEKAMGMVGMGMIPPKIGWRLGSVISPAEGVPFGKEDPTLPALFLLQRWVNDQLKTHVMPKLLYDVTSGTQMPQFVPQNLLGAMWLQFALAVAGDKKYRACKVCHKWFEISGKNRITRLFCSDACKTKDFRNRKIHGLAKKFVEEAREAIADKPSHRREAKKNLKKRK